MPEGPSIVILKEAVKHFKGKKILHAEGIAKIDMPSLENLVIKDIKTFGKQLLVCFPEKTIRIHLLMFGTYSIDEEEKGRRHTLKLGLHFAKGSVFFYACSVKELKGKAEDIFDFSGDIMNDGWSAPKAKKKLQDVPKTIIGDALLNQDIFAGIGNIIRNEALFRAKIHPESINEKIPAARLTALIKHTQQYSFDFLKWKKKDELKKHWKAYHQKMCPRCDMPIRKKVIGKTKRPAFFCENCQVKYS